jgi:hypothetical protein
MGKQGVQSKTAVRSSRKEAASSANGGNSSATKEKNLKKCQARNLQRKQSNIVDAPMKPPPAHANIPDFARAAAREQLKAAQERQSQNAAWRRLHERGSSVAFIHQEETLGVDESEDKGEDTSDGSTSSEEEMMQTKDFDKCKAWGSLRTPTKEAALTSPRKKKAKPDTFVDLTHSSDQTDLLEMDEMEYKQHNIDGLLDIGENFTKMLSGTLADTQEVIIMDGAMEDQPLILDTHSRDTDSNKLTATEAPQVALSSESQSGSPLLLDPPSILKRQKNKQSMLQAAASGTKAGTNPFFAPGNTNKEGIPVEDFKNIVFLKLTITVPSKPVEFSGTALKWDLQQFTEWFEQAREDLGANVPLILLSYSKSSAKEPEVMRDVSKFLKGMANTSSNNVFNFRLNNKAFSKGMSTSCAAKFASGPTSLVRTYTADRRPMQCLQ